MMQNPRHVGIKARITTPASYSYRVMALFGYEPEFIDQEDVYFPTPDGRLKLRIDAPDHGKLYYGGKKTASGPALASAISCETSTPDQLREVLTAALGVEATVRKRRQYWVEGRVRVHLDKVESLGHFLEIEIEVDSEEDVVPATEEVWRLMAELGIGEEQLVTKSYVDIIAGRGGG